MNLTLKLITRSNFFKAYLLAGFIAACGLIPVLRSSWLGDDWPISQTPYWIRWRYGEIDFQKILQEALYWNDQWMRGAGRFYPLTWVESRFTFAYLTGMQEYKIFQYSLLLMVVFLLTFYTFRITRSHTQSLIALIILPIFLQFRRDFDPHVAFANMLSSLLIKFLIASILLTYVNEQKKKRYKILISVTSAVFFLGALCTYEFAFLLLPALLLSIQQGENKRERQKFSTEVKEIFSKLINPYLIPPIAVWLFYGIFVFLILRPKATAVSGAYSLGISIDSTWVFFSQLFTATPLITLRMDDLKYISRNLAPLVLIFFLIRYLIKKIMHQISLQSKEQKPKPEQNFEIKNLMISLNLIAAPGLMLAMQPVWWGRANLFHSYLGVMISEIGMVFLATQLISRYLIKIKPSINLKSKK
jgi:hypothetical protein